MLIRKKFRFEAAHRLLNSSSERCRGIHGHSYVVEVFLEGEPRAHDGMVMDFGVIKPVMGKFIDRFDHSLVVFENDVLALPEKRDLLRFLNTRWVITSYHPTAEMMAAHIFWHGSRSLFLNMSKVIVHETETGFAECDRVLDGHWFENTVFSLPSEAGTV